MFCAGLMKETLGGLDCGIPGGFLENPLGRTIRRAVYGVNESRRPPREPEDSPYLWCPNCTAEMDVFDERGRELRCPECGLSLPAVTQLQLMEVREHHPKLDEAREMGYSPSLVPPRGFGGESKQ